MKTSRILITAVIATCAGLAFAGEPQTMESYGGVFAKAQTVNIDDAMRKPTRHEGRLRVFKGRVTQVCQKAGCWMFIEANGKGARIETAHKFEIPKDAAGAEALVSGRLQKVLNKEGMKEHLKSDGASDQAASADWVVQAQAVKLFR